MSAGAYSPARSCVEFCAATSSDADHRSPRIAQRAGHLMRSCRGMGRTCTRCPRGCPETGAGIGRLSFLLLLPLRGDARIRFEALGDEPAHQCPAEPEDPSADDV